MNIAANTRLLPGDVSGGIEWFTFEIFSRLSTMHPEHMFTWISDHAPPENFSQGENIETVVLGPVARHPMLWHWWYQYSLRRYLEKGSFDIFISPDGMIPFETSVPCLTVIHDISFVHRRRDLPWIKSYYYNRYYPEFAKRADRIVTVSEFSRDDMVSTWNIDPEKIDVVYNGASDNFFSENGELPVSTRKKYTEGKPYFLFVGNLSPRKNVVNLVRAYNQFRDNTARNHKLLIAGSRFFLNTELDMVVKLSPYKSDILFTGKVEQEELRRLYCAAESLIFTPWFEGFGIPVVEAMKCGTPVIASDSSALPEICGEAALMVNPADPCGISSGMESVTTDAALKNRLIESGLNRSKLFSWDRAADQFWSSILKTIKY